MFLKYSLFFCFMLTGCSNKNEYGYTIRDFPDQHQRYLYDIITSGVVGLSPSEDSLSMKFPNEELKKLSKSEHPLLRAVALRLLLERAGVDHQSLILSHLDDTALISMDYGEWGFRHTTVADDVLDHSTWKTEEDREVIVRKVLADHNNLHAAYKILHRTEPKPEYYLHIKKMIGRGKWFEETEGALYLLARYKKKEDIPVIKDVMLRNTFWLGVLSFRLIREFPDTSYLSVLDKFERRGMGRKLCEDPYSTEVDYFFAALASYKQERAAEILSRMLYRQPLVDCGRERNHAKINLMEAIWDNPCPAYAGLHRYIKDSITQIRKGKVELPSYPAPLPTDATGLKFRW